MLRVAAAVLLLALIGASPADAAWRWPLRGEVRRQFAVVPDRPYAAGQHRGVDLAARPGSAVRSVCAGRVRFAGRIGESGGVVSVRCGELVATYLELGVVRAVRDRRIGAGARLGTVGPAAHLHLGARDVRSGRYVDPLTLLRAPALGPAPDGAPLARPTRPARPPRVAPVPSRAPAGTPAVVWAGLALVAAALPVGGLAVRHRSRQRTSRTSTSPAIRWTRSSR